MTRSIRMLRTFPTRGPATLFTGIDNTAAMASITSCPSTTRSVRARAGLLARFFADAALERRVAFGCLGALEAGADTIAEAQVELILEMIRPNTRLMKRFKVASDNVGSATYM